MLILFDIDGTLVLTEGAGAGAMLATGRDLYGPGFSFDGVEIAGRLDPLIWADGMRASGLEPSDERQATFRANYARRLEERLTERPTSRLLPGVAALVTRLDAADGIVLGLLTGNYAETGRLKLESAGLDLTPFVIGAWGDDGSHRRDLPQVAMTRFREQTGGAIDAGQVIIIGDTPHDIDCARANGCLVLGVATGPSFTEDDLRAYEPDLLVSDLSETDHVVEWILATCAKTA